MLDVYVFDSFTYDSKNLDYIPWTRTNLYNITFHYINFVQKHILFFSSKRTRFPVSWSEPNHNQTALLIRSFESFADIAHDGRSGRCAGLDRAEHARSVEDSSTLRNERDVISKTANHKLRLALTVRTETDKKWTHTLVIIIFQTTKYYLKSSRIEAETPTSTVTHRSVGRCWVFWPWPGRESRICALM